MTQLTDADLLDIANQLKGLAARLSPTDVVVPPVVETPTSSGTFKVNIVSGFGKTVVVPADNGIVKDEKVIQFANGRTTTVIGVDSASAGFMTITTSEPPSDTDAGIAALSGTVATLSDRYAAPSSPTEPVEPSEPEQPEDPSEPVEPITSFPLVGVNMSGLGNNPYVENAVAGTHYREPEQKYFDKYQALGCKLIRLPIAPERCVTANKSELVPLYVSQIKSGLDKAAAADMKVIIDLHCYYRFWTTIAQGGGTAGYQQASYPNGNGNGQTVYKEWKPIGTNGCLIDSDGYSDLITKLVTTFGGHAAYLGIGLANEPCDGGEGISVNSLWLNDVQSHADAALNASTTGLVFIGGVNWCSALNWVAGSDSLKNIVDPTNRVIFEAHQYLDAGMNGGGAWSNRSEAIPLQNGVAMFKPFVDWLKANGKRGFIGESGVPADNPSAIAALKSGVAYLVQNGIPFTQWCAGPGWPSDDVNAVDDDNLTYKANLDAIKSFFSATTTAYGKAPQ